MTYQEKKEYVKQKAIDWKRSFDYCIWSYGEIGKRRN